MNIFVTGDKNRFKELDAAIGQNHDLHYEPGPTEKLEIFDVIIDLNLDENPGHIKFYKDLKFKPVIGCAVKRSLAWFKFEGEDINCQLFGMNFLPGFIDRKVAEVSSVEPENEEELLELIRILGWEPRIVSDRVGMVTPRVILMIINEACYTLQEGTAGMEDIDSSMKLGTNYPFGPFEWADRIGVRDVYESLDALWKDTREERYKICPLLKTYYLKQKSFY